MKELFSTGLFWKLDKSEKSTMLFVCAIFHMHFLSLFIRFTIKTDFGSRSSLRDNILRTTFHIPKIPRYGVEVCKKQQTWFSALEYVEWNFLEFHGWVFAIWCTMSDCYTNTDYRSISYYYGLCVVFLEFFPPTCSATHDCTVRVCVRCTNFQWNNYLTAFLFDGKWGGRGCTHTDLLLVVPFDEFKIERFRLHLSPINHEVDNHNFREKLLHDFRTDDIIIILYQNDTNARWVENGYRRNKGKTNWEREMKSFWIAIRELSNCFDVISFKWCSFERTNS